MRILFTYSSQLPFEIHFGLLYNSYAFRHANFAMPGWHVPTQTELSLLFSELGGGYTAGIALREPDLNYWLELQGCDNSSLMTERGAGLRTHTGSFANLTIYGYIVSTSLLFGRPRVASISYANNVSLSNGNVKYGMSVRLLKNDSVDPGSYVDYEGHVYPTTKVGSQVWTARNSVTQFLNDGTPIPEVVASAAWSGLSTPGLCAYNNDWSLV